MHKSAFGLNFKKSDLQSFQQKCNELLPLSELTTTHVVDWEIPAEDLTTEMVNEVAENHMIWGNDVPQPLFAITNLHINASQINAYGENKGFIRFVYNGIPFIKKYCPHGDYEEMTLRDNHVLGVNKKNLILNIIGQFSLNVWEDKFIPQVKILYYDVVEDKDNKYVPDIIQKETKIKKAKDSDLDDWDDGTINKKTKNEKEKTTKKTRIVDYGDEFVF